MIYKTFTFVTVKSLPVKKVVAPVSPVNSFRLFPLMLFILTGGEPQPLNCFWDAHRGRGLTRRRRRAAAPAAEFGERDS